MHWILVAEHSWVCYSNRFVDLYHVVVEMFLIPSWNNIGCYEQKKQLISDLQNISIYSGPGVEGIDVCETFIKIGAK